ncbi:hypothetical protein [Sporosarcina koreensis]|uniref:hypothetical protein n=1 Tax=Sporosarcina koreensis TaxID=334735 RepID=UPI00075588A2|nr:hypothetical protein [Sporosarcina koreensis]
MNSGSIDIESKLMEYHQSTQFHLNELKEALLQRVHRLDCITYFTYALHLAHDATEESFCLGSFHIQNIGNQPLTNPFIHIILSQDAPFSLHGKFVNTQTSLSTRLTGGWERMNDRSNRFEFHLRPIDKTSIQPGETLLFSNFQLDWQPSNSYFGSMAGILFCDQYPDGVAALNSININGTFSTGEEV